MKQVRVIVRAVAIVDALSRAPEGVGITDLARVTGLSKGTLHNILQTLVSTSLATADPGTKRYTLGPKPSDWASLFLESLDVSVLARPYLERLRDLTGETATLHVRADRMRVCVARAHSPQAIRRVAELGEIQPLWQSAAGRVLLSGMPDAEVDGFLRAADLEATTPKTITGRGAILTRVRRARRDGYSIAQGEVYADAAAVSAAIRDRTGGVVAALSVSGPLDRWKTRRMREHLPALLRVADDLSHRLGRPATRAPARARP